MSPRLCVALWAAKAPGSPEAGKEKGELINYSLGKALKQEVIEQIARRRKDT